MLERHGVCPFLAQGLDESLGSAVGSWRVRPGADVPELEDSAGFGKGLGDTGRSVVTHHLTTFDALSVEPGHGPAEDADRRGLLLVSQNVHIGEPFGVVDGDIPSVIAHAS